MRLFAYRFSDFKSSLAGVVGAAFLSVSIAAAILLLILLPSSGGKAPLLPALAAGFLILALGAAVLCAMAFYIVKPLRQLEKAAQRIAQGDTNLDLRIQRKDEIGSVAESLRKLAQSLRTM